ncbi:MogA/MoaB family molybdenum cofactor biosynthesis protein [Candidatus Nitronereus thalassa]|uniref:MogA/MoaB family molybdenum cofactor biosynthesis protein n=1 Tax=Candidatus Nitronereus thalassa TaxID=3020898 RepID=A0ABU3K4N4_9BACT|nr:MogA/MoaB family molybdenum cofactor biosynthesis protein [Candidatus Nitronereus thalassa]MDT7041357.1 MogA/MoaB family molybdenum cofactor biosynthesis protein [Candidatus Nitronereus thalassa]
MIRAAIIVVSSKVYSGDSPDKGRADLEQYLSDHDVQVVAYEIVPDDRKEIRECLVSNCLTIVPQVIFTLGGTGVRPTDWTPEATREVIDKEIPGIAEVMRVESLKKVKTAMLSRGTAGIRGSTLIVNLPGSPKAAKENLATFIPILEHTVEKISKITQPIS